MRHKFQAGRPVMPEKITRREQFLEKNLVPQQAGLPQRRTILMNHMKYAG